MVSTATKSFSNAPCTSYQYKQNYLKKRDCFDKSQLNEKRWYFYSKRSVKRTQQLLQHCYTHSATLLQYVETFVWFNRVAKCVQVQLCTTVMQYVAILLCVWPELKPVKNRNLLWRHSFSGSVPFHVGWLNVLCNHDAQQIVKCFRKTISNRAERGNFIAS